MKKAVSIFLSLLMVLSLIPVIAVSANAEETDSQTEIEYTEVRTVEDLYMISYALDGNYKLMNDIDLTTDTAKGGEAAAVLTKAVRLPEFLTATAMKSRECVLTLPNFQAEQATILMPDYLPKTQAQLKTLRYPVILKAQFI